MPISCLIALSVAVGMCLLATLFQEEIASVLCGSVAVVSLMVALVLTSWQIQLFLVVMLVGTSNYGLFSDRPLS